MKDTRFIKSIRLRNLLSFGPESEEIELRPLNVLIGPNASGKSNFIDAISLLRDTPYDISVPFRSGGGAKEWVWKGESQGYFEITTKTPLQHLYDYITFRHFIGFSIIGDFAFINEEVIEKDAAENDDDVFYNNKNGKAYLKTRKNIDNILNKELVTQFLDSSKDMNSTQSILSQRKDPFLYPELTSLGHKFASIAFYKNWYSGINANCRIPQQTDLPSAFLAENLNNFALVVDKLAKRRETRNLINEKLKLFYTNADYVSVNIQGGTAQVMVYEKGLNDPIPATRLSDGTLRYLCLLTILCHPEPPPLICIEEPEIGLHPDIMPTIAELLIDASKRTQLIVTTHSDVLVSALSETPESILVCEHDDAGTHMQRLEQEKLKSWLEKYSLGDLWLKGEIGGTRW
ncbi:MAG: AAA family ATPase [Candidatus Latescibacteria bacterium]|nr:AAA family ATPase [Candidatus Latescibacterota bacterium]